MFQVVFYEMASGRRPAAEYLASLKPDDAARMQEKLRLLQELGNELKMPHSKPLRDGIMELRTQNRGRWHRVLYFFVVGETVVLTHGFTKKTNKTSDNEIEKALKYKKDYETK